VKPQVMRAFLEDFFTWQGAKTEDGDKQILFVRAPRRLTARLGRSPLRFAFNSSGLKADPSSELAMVGNPVFDRILDLARDAGRVGERFLRVPGRSGRLPAPTGRLGVKAPSTGWGAPEQVYTPQYLFLMRCEFSLEELPDNLELVSVDGVTLEGPNRTPDLLEFWDSLESGPEGEREIVPAFPLREDIFMAAMKVLEQRLRRRIGRMKRLAREALMRESNSISSYYQQLIDETRNASRRWVMTPEDKDERVRLLQLDWKRRAGEAEDNWKPRVAISVAGVGVVQRPRIRYGAASPKAARGGRKVPGQAEDNRCIYWDETDKVFSVPAA